MTCPLAHSQMGVRYTPVRRSKKFTPLLNGGFGWNDGSICLHPSRRFCRELWEYMFTSIEVVLQATMGAYVYSHQGGLAGNYGIICLHPPRRFCRELWDYTFTFIEELLQGTMGAYAYIHRGRFAGYHWSIFLHWLGSFCKRWEYLFASIR